MWTKALKSAVMLAVVTPLQLVAAEKPVASSPLKVGDRVRVWASMFPKQVGGEVIEAGSDALTIRVSNRRESIDVPLALITRLERSLGKRSNTGKGALIGGSVGVALGAVAVATCSGDGCPGQANHQAAVIGALGGVAALVGAAVGSFIEVERWETIPSGRIGVRVLPHRGGVGASLSVRF